MHCGGCAQHVQAALRGVEGVADATVNLLDESAAVVMRNGGVPIDRLISAVRGAGYDAEALASGRELIDRYAANTEQRETLRRHRQAVIQAVFFTVWILVVDNVLPLLWGKAPQQQVGGRFLELILLVMLMISPGGAPILVGGLRALLHRTGNMDLLISMGVMAATISSFYGVFVAHDPAFIHIHAAAVILALVCIGRYLEARAKGKASQAMAALATRAPRRSRVQRDGAFVSLPVEEIVVGDIVQVPPHEVIPVDGVVVDGVATVDESLMTGEPTPVERRTGDSVLGGTLVAEGVLELRATLVGSRSALGRIIQLVATAQASQTRMQRLADRVAAVFTPIVLTIALFVFIGWLVLHGRAGLAMAAQSAVSVLVVACPCALGLATPTVVMVASGMAALRGILVRDAAMLEAMGRVNVVVWDKTGTLTMGKPIVTEIMVVGDWRHDDILALAGSAEQLAQHPVGRAMVAEAKQRGILLSEPAEFESIPGGGVVATVDGRSVVVGKASFLQERGVNVTPVARLLEAPNVAGEMCTIVAVDATAVGVIKLSDAVRPSARQAIERLASLGIRSELLTGDVELSARTIAVQAGIPLGAVSAGVTPAGKVAHVEAMRRDDMCVAMVGDGINDAAALAAADVGVAFASGADIAGEAAGINLIGSTPKLVVDAVVLARASVRIIRQNLFWAFFYNILMIPIAAMGHVPPTVAAGAMMLSSLTVVWNALRLRRMKFE